MNLPALITASFFAEPRRSKGVRALRLRLLVLVGCAPKTHELFSRRFRLRKCEVHALLEQALSKHRKVSTPRRFPLPQSKRFSWRGREKHQLRAPHGLHVPDGSCASLPKAHGLCTSGGLLSVSRSKGAWPSHFGSVKRRVQSSCAFGAPPSLGYVEGPFFGVSGNAPAAIQTRRPASCAVITACGPRIEMRSLSGDAL